VRIPCSRALAALRDIVGIAGARGSEEGATGRGHLLRADLLSILVLVLGCLGKEKEGRRKRGRWAKSEICHD
jgi:hypothetical protein